jgi:hypothetical protein
VTANFQGQVNPQYYYYVALQASPTQNAQDAHPENGPFAIVQANSGQNGWGNGWGTGVITDYVLYHSGQAIQYSYACSAAQTAGCPAAIAAPGLPIGPPFQASVSGTGQSLVVAIDLSTLGLGGVLPSVPSTTIPGGVVVNVIVKDHIEQVINNPSPAVDSLDVALAQSPPLLDLHQSKIVSLPVTVPPSHVLFPSGSVVVPDLEITGVSIEVRLP